MNQEVIILRGLPASGKTTWARQHCADHTWFRRVSKDDIRAMLGAGYSKPNEETVRSIRDVVIRSLVDDGYSVIVDDTNTNVLHIRKIEGLCVKLRVSCRVMNFDTSVETCIERDAQRVMPVGADVIRRMNEQWHGTKLTDAEMDYLRNIL